MKNTCLPFFGMKQFFRLCFATLFLWGLSLSVNAQTGTLTKVPYNTRSSNIKGYIEYLPPNYDASGNTKYPVLYWLHGLGEDVGGGTSASLEYILNGQIANWLKTNDVGFIVLIPQDFSGYWNGATNGIKQFVDWANGYYQNVIDVNQQHMAGLSSGGYGIRDFINANTATYQAFATFTPMSTNLNAINGKASQIIANNQYVWIHHNTGDVDPNALTSVTPFHNNVYALDPTRSRITSYDGTGHNSWEKVYNGTGRSTAKRTGTVSGTTYYNWTATDPDWYAWMLSHGKVTAPTPPTVNAGSDVSITLPTNSITLSGSATTSSGTTIAGYSWTKISGPAATITAATSASTTVTSLVEGTYVFRLTVTNSASLSASDDVTVTVIQIPTPPVVRTGVVVSASAGSVRFMGSATDDGGTLTYAWTKISGPAVTLQNQTTAVLTVSGFTEGTYVFGLTTTDDDNLSVTSEVILFVEASASAREAVSEVENTKAVTMFRELTPGTDVMIFNASQEKVFQGKWDASRFQDVFNAEGLYMYHVFTNGQRSTGKLFVKK